MLAITVIVFLFVYEVNNLLELCVKMDIIVGQSSRGVQSVSL